MEAKAKHQSAKAVAKENLRLFKIEQTQKVNMAKNKALTEAENKQRAAENEKALKLVKTMYFFVDFLFCCHIRLNLM